VSLSTSSASRGSGSPNLRSGMGHAIAAYALWGILPLYWFILKHLPLASILAHRVLWSLATILLFLAFGRGLPEFARALQHGPTLRRLGVSALLIGTNWSLYIYAVYSGQVVEASLGYYINPLVSVGLGIAVLRERLNAFQAAAVLIAAIGVAIMAWEGGIPWLALGLAVSFALYGLAKKRLDVGPLAGLGVETLWLCPIAAAVLAWPMGSGEANAPAFLEGPGSAALLVGTGLVTLAPLFFFNGAARRLPLSTLGFFQYLSPSIQLGLAVLLFGEPFTARHAGAFGCIWLALGIFSWDILRKVKTSRSSFA
jgi:chloramphenicol-sensitive protein RarD